MGEYNIIQWMTFFYFYCVVGWIWESSYCSVKGHKLINRGFMRGPMIPIYGSGAVVMLIAAMPFKGNLLLIFLSGMVLASLLEYCTGAAMEMIFKVRYWDYSNVPLNLNGHICLPCSIGWGFATILMTSFIHAPVERIVMNIPMKYLELIVMIITLMFGADFSVSFKAAIDLRDILIKMDEMKAEVDRMHKRVDVVLAFADDEKNQWAERQHERIEDMVTSLEGRLQAAKDKIDLSEETREELAELKARAMVMKERAKQLIPFKDYMSRAIIKGNPDIISRKFKGSLEELKAYVNSKR